MSFYTGTQCEQLYSLAAPVTNTAFTTQRVVSAPSTAPRAIVPAGFFSAVPNGVGRGLLVKAAGTLANQATAATFANVLAYEAVAGTIGTALIVSTPALAPTASTIVPWDLEALITCQAVGQSGLTLQCNGAWRQSVAATNLFTTAGQLLQFSANLTGLNSEAQAFIELWSTCSASGTSVIVVQQFDVFGLN